MKHMMISGLAATLLLAGLSPLGSSVAMAQSSGQAASAPTVEIEQSYQLLGEWAKDYLQSRGYTNVQNLKKDPGGWTATAMKNGQRINIDLDTAGGIHERKGS